MISWRRLCERGITEADPCCFVAHGLRQNEQLSWVEHLHMGSCSLPSVSSDPLTMCFPLTEQDVYILCPSMEILEILPMNLNYFYLKYLPF